MAAPPLSGPADLRGQSALMTGGARGIGFALRWRSTAAG
jgi:NAD(P)-dependent dehydrogenase (short-subunit alcohol dehydrogenase family)